MTYFYREPPIGLLEKIMTRIHKEERIFIIKKLVVMSVIFIISMLGFVPSLQMLLTEASNSGFINFSSLLFSDFSTVTRYWQSFTMILLETLPATSLALFLTILFILCRSAVSLTKNVKTIITLAK